MQYFLAWFTFQKFFKLVQQIYFFRIFYERKTVKICDIVKKTDIFWMYRLNLMFSDIYTKIYFLHVGIFYKKWRKCKISLGLQFL